MIQDRDEGLKREIGVFGLSANLINITVGAGIFVLPALVAEGLGPSGFIAYLYCGVLVALSMLCFAEAGSKVTTSGGAYSYIEVAFGKYAGFIAITLFLCACVTGDAAVANALADVLSTALPVFQEKWIRALFFFVVFSILAYINIIGVKQGIGLVKFLVVAKLAPLLLLVMIGMPHIASPQLTVDAFPPIQKLGEASLLLFFAFQGIESGLTIGGEVKNPRRTIPRSIFIAVAVVLILYIILQLIAEGVLGTSLPASKNNALAEVAKVLVGPIGFTLVSVGAAVSMFGMISGDTLSIPRVVFRAAKDKIIIPFSLSRVHAGYATPFIAIIAYAVVDFILASTGGFKQLAILSSASMLLIYLGVAFSVLKLRRMKEVNTENSFRIPGGLLVPVAAILVILYLLTNLSRNELLGVAVFIAVLSVIFMIMRQFNLNDTGS